MKRLKKDLTTKILLSLVIGVIFGFVLKLVPGGVFRDTFLVNGILTFLGTGFINLIKMTVVPLVFISLICGMSSLQDAKKVGRIGVKVICFYMITTAVAIVVALVLGLLLKPGSGIDMSHIMQGDYIIPESQPVIDVFLGMIPVNPIQAMAEGNMIQIIIFAVILGLALNAIGEKGKGIIDLFSAGNDLIMKVVEMIMKLAPIGVFALISKTAFTVGLDSLVGIAKFIAIVAIGMLIHGIVIYGGILKVFTRLPIKNFFNAYKKIAGVTFSTSSSNAALPLSMQTMENIGVDKSICSFALPLGATINMDGTAIMQGVAVVFIAQVYGIELSIGTLLTVILTAVLASIGTAGVPGVGMITLSMVLQSANLPLEGIALIIGFDRILDMMRTTVNVMGDCVCSMIVAKSEKCFDTEKYLNS